MPQTVGEAQAGVNSIPEISKILEDGLRPTWRIQRRRGVRVAVSVPLNVLPGN
jgi:hypothetical protein